jgi:hypothetical protein
LGECAGQICDADDSFLAMENIKQMLDSLTLKDLIVCIVAAAVIVFARDGRKIFRRRKNEKQKN